jgi:opacity protein-like surface antigen
MISVVSQARFATRFKSFFLSIAAPIGLAAFLCSAWSGGALAQPATPPPVYGTGAYTPPPVYGTGAYTPPVYNPFYYTPGTSTAPVYPSYNAPVTGGLPPVYNAPVTPFYNAPWEGGGFYFGPTGSASFLQDSDLIKRIEPRTTDSLWSMPRSINGTSTNWASSSGSLRSGSDSWRGLSEGGSKTRVLSSSTGYNVGARAGYQVGNFRFEGEFDYANNSADTLENPHRREISTDLFRRDDTLRGSTTGMTFLGNVIYDFNVPGLSGYGVTPHVLGGIGAGRISTDLKWGDRTIVNSSDWNFAYQLGAGVRYQVMPNWSLDLDYRYRGIADTTLRNEFAKITVPYRSHNFVASVTWQLPPLWGVMAPATPYMPPPPPPPPPSRPGLPVM